MNKTENALMILKGMFDRHFDNLSLTYVRPASALSTLRYAEWMISGCEISMEFTLPLEVVSIRVIRIFDKDAFEWQSMLNLRKDSGLKIFNELLSKISVFVKTQKEDSELQKDYNQIFLSQEGCVFRFRQYDDIQQKNNIQEDVDNGTFQEKTIKYIKKSLVGAAVVALVMGGLVGEGMLMGAIGIPLMILWCNWIPGGRFVLVQPFSAIEQMMFGWVFSMFVWIFVVFLHEVGTHIFKDIGEHHENN